MRRLLLAAGFSACLTLGLGLPAAADASVNTFYVEVSGRFANPCYEVVDLAGRVKVTETRTGNHIGLHVNYAGVSGTGEVSGLSYRAIGAFEQDTNVDTGTATAPTMLRFVSQTSLPDLVIH